MTTVQIPKADIPALAASVAPHLGAGWTATPGEWSETASLRGPDGTRLHMSRSRQAGQVTIGGSFPRTSYYFRDGEHAEINVNAGRGADVIAREIMRRLLPGYLGTLAKVREHEATVRAEADARLTLAAQITGLFPISEASLPGHCQSETRTEILIHSSYDHGSGWVRFHGAAETISLDLTGVPPGVAVRMLAVLAKAGQDS